MKLVKLLVVATAVFSLSACTNWIYRIDIPQGNYLDSKDVEKLRVGMSKEQVVFVLGHPVVEDSFNKSTWYYVYEMKRGMTTRGNDFKKELIIQFESDKVANVVGDFELPEEFYTPLDA